jgi:DNA-binding SARP family transcriptional activator
LAPSVRIQVCGHIALLIDGERRESELPGRQGRELFALLVLRRDRAMGRVELLDLLWPAGAPVAAEAALSALLSKLRRIVGPDVLIGRTEPHLRLPAGTFVDFEAASEATHRAESAVAAGEWAAGWGPARVALHTANRGLLPGHEGAWIDERRRVLEDLRMRALECVAAIGLGLGAGELASAERAGRTLVASWPFHESGYRALISALEARGNVAEALLIYEQLRCLLRDELGIVPSGDLQAYHQRLLLQRS